MDISEITKVATRKKMSADVENLREKVSRENRKIIKLRVAQDTAYWDLKEKLRQVETNHEKLQQNMLEVQMQYENVSGQYQEELRHRPEILNKLGTTREICNVLVDYTERLRETLTRCKADQAALCEAYQQSGEVVREMKTQQMQNEEKNKQIIENLQDKLKLTTDHQSQLVQYFTSEKQRVEAELSAVKTELASAVSAKEQLSAINAERGRQLDQSRQDLEKKEEAISGLQRDIRQLIYEFNSQASEMTNKMLKIEKELKETTADNDSLKTALTNQEIFTKSICEQNNQLQEKLAASEEELNNAGKIANELRANLQNATRTNENLKTKIASLTEKEKTLQQEINDKTRLLAEAEQEKQGLLSKVTTMEQESAEIAAALSRAAEEVQELNGRIQELTVLGGERQKEIEDIQVALKKSRDATEAKIKELTATLESKNRELDSKASTISHLMTEVKSAVDARAKLELTLQTTKNDMEEERKVNKEREMKLAQQIEKLEIVVRNKDEELSKNMKIVMELRSEKERLHEKIQSKQNTIDNIQKELARPLMRPPPDEAEQDDNAVMLTPTSIKRQRLMREPQYPAPRAEPKNDLFNFLSDSSFDGDNTLDPTEVNRRFEALSRGERLSPLPLSSVKKRRAAMPIPHGGLRPKQAPNKDEDLLSLSQIKETMKSKPRTFFKHHRNENKAKRN